MYQHTAQQLARKLNRWTFEEGRLDRFRFSQKLFNRKRIRCALRGDAALRFGARPQCTLEHYHVDPFMRLFTAIDLPADVLMRSERLISALPPQALISWSPLDKLHVTTKFIGEWPEARLEDLHQALAALVPREPFDVDVKQLGWFPNERSPRVLWVGVHGGEQLAALAKDTEERLLTLGIQLESRKFSPHLTLARLRNPFPLAPLREKVEEMQPAGLGKFVVSHFSLFHSETRAHATVYRKLRQYQFESAASTS